MSVTDRDLRILGFLTTQRSATTEMIRDEVMPEDEEKRICRKRLRKLATAGLIWRHDVPAHRLSKVTVTLWVITDRGRSLVEAHPPSGNQPAPTIPQGAP